MSIGESEVPLKALRGYSEVSDLLERKSPCGCTLIREFHIEHLASEDLSGTCVSFVLVHDRKDPEGARFVFTKVGGLKIQDTFQVSGLAVRDVRSRGWEGYRFEVYDYENAAFTFFCWDIVISRAYEKG
jgi:hypothetical protein